MEKDSVLHAILIEIKTLDAEKHPVSFAFALMSALDLLAQLNSGKLNKIGAVKRFKRFTGKYLGLREVDQEVLYQYRNAVVHTFGQYAFNEKTKQEYRFVYHIDDRLLLKKVSRSVYSVNLPILQLKVEKAAEQFLLDVENDSALKERYNLVYRKVGRTISPLSTS